MTGFFASLDLADRPVVVCGAGPESLAPVRALLDAGAQVTVMGAEVSTTVTDLAERGLITLATRPWADADLAAARLVVPATGDAAADQRVLAAAREHGVLSVSAVPRSERSDSGVGSVILVGGGPGDPGLLTVAGLDAIRTADVIVSDRLAPIAVLEQAKPGAEIIDVGKIPRGAFTSQERINELLVEHGRAGRTVVRLKGGDNFVFGRGGEEWQACAAAGLPVRIVPGVSSAIAAPALAGIPLTHRQLTQGFTVVSGHLPPGDPGSTLDWAALARANTTLVILMGVATLPAITAALVAAGLDPATPAATIADAGLTSQRSVTGRVADIAQLTAAAGLTPPAVTVIGAVVGFAATVEPSVPA